MGAITEPALRPISKRGGVRDYQKMFEIPKRERDSAGESTAARAALVGRVMKVRDIREAGELERNVMQIAQAFIVCCPLPYVRTSESRIQRTAKMGDGSRITVTLSAVTDAEMAFGSDRVLLYWLFNKAIKLQSRFIPLCYVSEYLGDMGLTDCGKNRRDLIERIARVSGIFICVNRVDKLGKKAAAMLPMFRAYNLPSAFSWDKDQEPINFDPEHPLGIEFSEDFFQDLMRHRVPVPMDFIKATRKQSQIQDLVNFIYYRSYIGQNKTLIPWEEIRNQIWHGDKNLRRLKALFRQVKVVLRAIWPEIDIEVESEGLRITPHAKKRLRRRVKVAHQDQV